MLKRTVVHHTALGKSGGATKVARLIHEGLLQAGHQSVHSFEASENPGDPLLSPEEAAGRISAGNIVHLHSSADPVRFMRALPADTRLVITLHDTQMITGGCASPMDCPGFDRDCRRCPRNFPDAENARAEKIAAIIDSNALLVSPSGWLGRLVRRADRRLKARIIPNGIPWPEHIADSKKARKELGIHPASKILLFVAHGGVEAAYKSGPQWKNYWAQIKKSAPEALCFAIGGRENKREGDFISIPYLESAALGKFMAAADVLAYPTRGDNHPLIILEAMAQGLPAVSYAVGGVVEQITDNADGILVSPYEKNIFTEKAAMLLNNKRLAREMGSRAFHKGERRFSCARMLGDYLKIYYNLV